MEENKLNKSIKQVKEKQRYMESARQYNVPKKSSPTISTKVEDEGIAKNLLRLVMTLDPSRGHAIINLTLWMINKEMVDDYSKALQISAELLASETIETCETINILARDGYEGNLGEILKTSRNLTKN